VDDIAEEPRVGEAAGTAETGGTAAASIGHVVVASDTTRCAESWVVDLASRARSTNAAKFAFDVLKMSVCSIRV
jgi:hypothetical protein